MIRSRAHRAASACRRARALLADAAGRGAARPRPDHRRHLAGRRPRLRRQRPGRHPDARPHGPRRPGLHRRPRPQRGHPALARQHPDRALPLPARGAREQRLRAAGGRADPGHRAGGQRLPHRRFRQRLPARLAVRPGRGFAVYDDRFSAGESGEEFALPERRGDATVAAARAWWQARGGGKPRFFWLHLFDPHAPYAPPEPFATRYAAEPYLGEVAAVDSYLAPFLQPSSRDKNGRRWSPSPPTTANRLGEHGEATHGLFAYEATLKVPLLLWGAGVDAGQRRPAGPPRRPLPHPAGRRRDRAAARPRPRHPARAARCWRPGPSGDPVDSYFEVALRRLEPRLGAAARPAAGRQEMDRAAAARALRPRGRPAASNRTGSTRTAVPPAPWPPRCRSPRPGRPTAARCARKRSPGSPRSATSPTKRRSASASAPRTTPRTCWRSTSRSSPPSTPTPAATCRGPWRSPAQVVAARPAMPLGRSLLAQALLEQGERDEALRGDAQAQADRRGQRDPAAPARPHPRRDGKSERGDRPARAAGPGRRPPTPPPTWRSPAPRPATRHGGRSSSATCSPPTPATRGRSSCSRWSSCGAAASPPPAGRQPGRAAGAGPGPRLQQPRRRPLPAGPEGSGARRLAARAVDLDLEALRRPLEPRRQGRQAGPAASRRGRRSKPSWPPRRRPAVRPRTSQKPGGCSPGSQEQVASDGSRVAPNPFRWESSLVGLLAGCGKDVRAGDPDHRRQPGHPDLDRHPARRPPAGLGLPRASPPRRSISWPKTASSSKTPIRRPRSPCRRTARS